MHTFSDMTGQTQHKKSAVNWLSSYIALNVYIRVLAYSHVGIQ